MVVINPLIENTTTLEDIDWKPLLTVHSKRSSVIEISKDNKYLKKTKKRKGKKRDFEFYNLAFWNILLENYNNTIGTEIHAPTPYISEGRDLVMEYGRGFDLDRLLRSASIGPKEVEQIMRRMGMLFKIKENESLIHNDFDLRHILVDGGLFIIDLENAQYGKEGVKKENDKLIQSINVLYSKSIEEYILEGMNKVPKMRFLDCTLDSMKSKYGGRAEFYLKNRYRDKK